MRSSEIANLPAWRGQPGYYEIWFLVVFDPEPGRATWLRYTTFAPASGGEPRATLWAAAFDDRAAEPAVAVKAVFPLSSYDGGGDRFHVRIGGAEIGHGFCRGEVRSEALSSPHRRMPATRSLHFRIYQEAFRAADRMVGAGESLMAVGRRAG